MVAKSDIASGRRAGRSDNQRPVPGPLDFQIPDFQISKLLEDPTDSEGDPPVAVEAEAGAKEHRPDERVGDQSKAEVRIDVRLLMGVEHGAVLKPGADGQRTAHEIREARDLSERAEGQDGVVIAAAFTNGKGVEQVWVTGGELPRRERRVVERRPRGEHGKDPVSSGSASGTTRRRFPPA